MINILITGANGQLGQSFQYLKNIKTLPTDCNLSFFNHQELDITKPEEIEKVITSEYDFVINCASYTNVEKAEVEEAKAREINATAVKYLANICAENNSTLIHISTDYVFDGGKTTSYTEQDIPNPLNVYGHTKLEGEQSVIKNTKQYYIIRCSGLFSPFGANFVKTMLRLFKEEENIRVVEGQISSPTYALDLAKVIIDIIKSGKQKYGVYHYANQDTCSWYEFAKAIQQYTSSPIALVPIKSEDYSSTITRPKYSVLDTNKIISTFGLEIPNWKKSLEKCLALINS